MNYKTYMFHIFFVQADGGLLFLNALQHPGECKDALAQHFNNNGGEKGTYAVINEDTGCGRLIKATRDEWRFDYVGGA